MFKIVLTFALLLCFCLSGRLQAHEFEYSGTMTLGNGLLAGGNWNVGPTTLSWQVFHPGPPSVEFSCGDCRTTYSYTFSHPATDKFEFFLEAQENMVLGSIFDVSSTLPNY